MSGRAINEAEVLRLAGPLARTAPSEYGRLKGILARCPTVNENCVPLEEEKREWYYRTGRIRRGAMVA